MNGATAVSRVLNLLRLIVALALFAASLLVLFPAPTYTAWKLEVAVTEWGHFLPIPALILLLPGWTRSSAGRFAAFLAVFALLLSLAPLTGAIAIARSLPDDLQATFGTGELGAMADAPPRAKPVVFADLFKGVQSSPFRLDSLTYVVRDGEPVKLDVYRPVKSPGRAMPLVMIIHGGSWGGRSRDDLPALNRYLAARGYVVASPDYRLVPRYPHPAASEDIHVAIAFLKRNASRLELDPSRIVLIGRSAGGQLALLAAFAENDPAIRGAVGMYAPSDQVYGYAHPTNPRVLNTPETLEGFLSGNPRTAGAAYRSSSPVNFVGPSTVPTLLIHGAKDELVFVHQSDRLEAKLALADRPHFFLRMWWATHGCDYNFSGPCGQLSTYAIERFLAAVMQ